MNTEENIDIWIKCWVNKKFPKGNPTYSEWKRFWDWWYSKPFFDLKEAYNFYEKKLSNMQKGD